MTVLLPDLPDGQTWRLSCDGDKYTVELRSAMIYDGDGGDGQVAAVILGLDYFSASPLNTADDIAAMVLQAAQKILARQGPVVLPLGNVEFGEGVQGP